MSVLQRWFPLALGAACLLGCGDDSNPSDHEDSGAPRYDASLNPVEGDGDGDGDVRGDGDGDGDTNENPDDGSIADAGTSKPDAGGKPRPQHDAGTTPSTPDASTPGGGTQKGTPVFVAVGYAGRHIRSTDLGVTWTDEEFLDPQRRGQDDEFLLRSVTFAKGVFVAAGWKIMVSKDGSAGSWTEHTVKGQQWVGGITFGNGKFVGTGGYGMAAVSEDGINWTTYWGMQNQASRSVAFGDGKFTSATDQGNWWTSTDGTNWSLASNGHNTQVAYCGSFKNADQCSGSFSARNRAVGEGVTIRSNNGTLERSTNGVNFTKVPVSGGGFEGVAFGYVE